MQKYGYGKRAHQFRCYCYPSILATALTATVACAILKGTFGFGPSSETIDIRYVKLVTILSFCSLTLFSLWMPLLLFVISLGFSAHISILYLVQILSRLSSKASSSCSTLAILSVIAMGRPQIGNSSTAYTNLSFLVSLSIRYNPFEKNVKEGRREGIVT